MFSFQGAGIAQLARACVGVYVRMCVCVFFLSIQQVTAIDSSTITTLDIIGTLSCHLFCIDFPELCTVLPAFRATYLLQWSGSPSCRGFFYHDRLSNPPYPFGWGRKSCFTLPDQIRTANRVLYYRLLNPFSFQFNCFWALLTRNKKEQTVDTNNCNTYKTKWQEQI